MKSNKFPSPQNVYVLECSNQSSRLELRFRFGALFTLCTVQLGKTQFYEKDQVVLHYFLPFLGNFAKTNRRIWKPTFV